MSFFDEGDELKKALIVEYGGFADRRVKDVKKASTFIADDRGTGDYGADRKLFLWFCSIFVDVRTNKEVCVRLSGGIPLSTDVKSWIKAEGAVYVDEPVKTLTFDVSKGQEKKLVKLAQAIASITAPGAPRYTVRSYKYVCPRTAAALERLAAALHKAWS